MKYIIIPLFVGVITQCIKFIIETIKTKKIDIIRLFDGMGGMPSTHSALVSSLSTIIYLNYGMESPLTSIAIIFSLIVIYDSMGIRYESGRQAQLLNRLTDSNLKEQLGHKPLETLVGVFLGIVLAILINMLLI